MDELTSPQREAVTHVDGPLLIVAGPGSGKTRVVTQRIAHMVRSGIPPRQILAITFTNKAAGELQERIAHLLPGTFVWATTFHKFCARILREYGETVGIKSNFSILDVSDQRRALKEVISDLQIDPIHYSPAKIGWRISTAKNDLLTPERFRDETARRTGSHWDSIVAQVYPAYQKWLLESNGVDFDDLLLHTAVMLHENPELREQLDRRFRYILVDEYQDTNAAQYRIVALLSRVYPNLCVTGDPDQSIYGWRGARIENILRFERDFPGARVVRLEQNFRSTAAILRSADSLIGNNLKRKSKRLLTDNPEGEPVRLLCFGDAVAEADGVARQIQELVASGDYTWSDIAITYRVNALSRQLEQALARHKIPAQLASGVAFYERTEIKNLLSYLRLIHNPADRAAFLRIVNVPLRGLGETSQRRLLQWADLQKVTLLEAAAKASEVSKLSARAAKGFQHFQQMIQECTQAADGGVGPLLELVVDRTGYRRGLLGSPSEQDRDRLHNIDELIAAAYQYDETAGPEGSLEAFLETTALVNETDNLDAGDGRVTMMTLHAAKGLEFPVVFVVGVEDGLIPHERSKRDAEENSDRELEEERRLLFVGMTRAKRRLYLTQSRVRALHGREAPTIISPFLQEFEHERVDLDDFRMPAGHEWADDEPVILLDSRHGEETDTAEGGESNRPTTTDLGARLFTAADLLSGTTGPAALPQGFAQGMQVRHPKYGTGTVIHVGGYGLRRTVTVRFQQDGREQDFVASKAPLQPIGMK